MIVDERQWRSLVARLDALERKQPVQPTLTGDFVAREGQTLNLEPPGAGMRGTLVKATPFNRGARVTFFQRNKNPVRLQAVDGKVNGAAFVISNAPGAFDAVSDGETGWSLDQNITSTGATGAPATSQYLLGASDPLLPNGRVASDSTEIDADLTVANVVSWALLAGSVVFAKLQNLTGLSVLGRAANSAGVMAAITATGAGQYLRENAAGNALEWGNPTSPSVVNTAGTFQRAALTGDVTAAQNSNATAFRAFVADSYLGSVAGGVPTDLGLSSLAGDGLTFAGHQFAVNPSGSLGISVGHQVIRAALTGAITAAADSNATAFGTFAAKSVLANATNAVAVPAPLSGSAAFQHLRVNSANTGLEWSVLTTGDFPAGSVPINALAAFPTWAQVLAAGNTTGATAPIVSFLTTMSWAGNTLAALNISGLAASNDCLINSAGTIKFSPAVTLNLAGTDILLSSVNTAQAAGVGWNFTGVINPSTSVVASNSATLFGKSGTNFPRAVWRDNTGRDWPLDCNGLAPQLTAATVSAAITPLALTQTFSIPASLMVAGSSWRVKAQGKFVRGATLTATNLVFTFNVGGVNVATAATATFVVTGAGHFCVDCAFTVLTTGAGGTCMAVATVTGDVGNNAAFSFNSSGSNPALACNTTIALNVNVTVNMTVAVAACVLTALGGHIERVN